MFPGDGPRELAPDAGRHDAHLGQHRVEQHHLLRRHVAHPAGTDQRRQRPGLAPHRGDADDEPSCSTRSRAPSRSSTSPAGASPRRSRRNRRRCGGSSTRRGDRLYVIHERSPFMTVVDPQATDRRSRRARVRIRRHARSRSTRVRDLVCLGGGNDSIDRVLRPERAGAALFDEGQGRRLVPDDRCRGQQPVHGEPRHEEPGRRQSRRQEDRCRDRCRRGPVLGRGHGREVVASCRSRVRLSC